MNILFYHEPSMLLDQSTKETSSVVLNYHFWECIAETFIDRTDVSIKTIVPEITYKQNEVTHLLDRLNVIPFDYKSLFEVFKDSNSLLSVYLKVFTDDISNDEKQRYTEFILRSLDGWIPDLIISYPIHNNLLKEIYPNSLNLTMENGIFSRPPFPRALRFDSEHFLNGFLNKYSDKINVYEITESQNQSIENLKLKLKMLIDSKNPHKTLLDELKTRYKYLVLCPIITSNDYKETKCDDQFTYLKNILEKIPSDTGVIVTFHDNAGSQLNTKVINYFKSTFPNLIHLSQKKGSLFQSASLFFMSQVDAVINCQSMTGLQALLFGPKIISMDKTYSKWFCDKEGIENIKEFLQSPKANKNNLLYWYLTHFSVFEKRFNEPDWYYNYFKKKIEKFRKEGINFDFYEQIEDIDELSEYILKYVDSQLNPPPPIQPEKPKKRLIKKISAEIGRAIVKIGEKIKYS